jgi:hypothetical protein
LPHNQGLLVVFAAEVRHVGRNLLKEFQHDSGHAAKMPGAPLSFPVQRDTGRFDVGGKARRIDFVLRRRVHQTDAAGRQGLEISGKSARVFVEIFVWSELRRIDENAHDDKVALTASCLDQADMPLVQRTHRGHETDAVPWLPSKLDPRAQFGRRAYDGNWARGGQFGWRGNGHESGAESACGKESCKSLARVRCGHDLGNDLIEVRGILGTIKMQYGPLPWPV